jgi:hypothetical protein
MLEGIPTYPDASRFWQVIDKHQVNATKYQQLGICHYQSCDNTTPMLQD